MDEYDAKDLSVMAEAILTNPVFIGVMGKVRDRIFSEWSKSDSLEKREKLFYEYEAAGRIINEIQQVVNTFKIMEHNQNLASIELL